MAVVSTFELSWVHIPEWEYGPERRFLDYIIDGRSLSEYLDGQSEYGLCKPGGLISGLGWGPLRMNEQAFNEFSLLAPARFPEERNPIYICIACGDPGCGAITAVMRREGDLIVWEKFFKYQSIHGEPGAYYFPTEDFERESLNDAGPFYFDAQQYLGTLNKAFDEVKEALKNTTESNNVGE